MSGKIAIIGLPNDHHASAVRWGLDVLGVESELFLPSDLPNYSTATISFPDGKPLIETRHVGSVATLSSANLIWVRRMGYPAAPPWADPRDTPIIESQCWEHVQNIVAILARRVRCINNPNSSQAASRKAFQLMAATEVGFNVPRTLISNDFENITKFVDCGFQVISKGYHTYKWVENDVGYSDLANLVEVDLTPHRQSIELAPRIYQERIDKVRDVRVVSFGDNYFGLATASNDTQLVDYRYEAHRNPESESRHAVPDEIASLIRVYMKTTGLDYGAFDFCIDRNNKWYFLECNDGGQFLYLDDRDHGLLVLETFCQWLAAEAGLSTQKSTQEISMTAFYKAHNKQIFLDYESHRTIISDFSVIK
jgi:hypothetical protein